MSLAARCQMVRELAQDDERFPDDELVVDRAVAAGDDPRRLEAMALSRDVVVDAWLEGKF